MRGFSLIELLLVLVISYFMINNLYAWYLSVKEHTSANVAYNHLNQQQLLLDNVLQEHLRTAGFLGCGHWGAPAVYNQRSQQIIISAISTYPRNANMALSIRQMSKIINDVSEILSSNVLVLNGANTSLANGDSIIIADCKHAEINVIKHISKSKQHLIIHLTYPLHATYQTLTMVGKYQEDIFYLAISKSQSEYKPWYGLFLSNTINSDEICEGIAEFKLEVASNSLHFQEISGDINATQYNLLRIKLLLKYISAFNGKIYTRSMQDDIHLREFT